MPENFSTPETPVLQEPADAGCAAQPADEQASAPAATPETGTCEAADTAAPESPLPPLSVSEPDNPLPPVRLEDLPAAMQEACARAGWTKLMPVQSLALPYLMAGRDIMIQSQTGSGKTGCYLLPLLPVIDPSRKEPQALVLAPTRELALQVEKEAVTIFGDTGVKPLAIYGGVGYRKQMDGLREGAQLVVGTPGRILDHILRHTLDLSAIRVLIFDEADRMLSIGFYPDMKEIQKYLPRRRIHTGLFSATYPPHVLNLAAEFMSEPCLLSLSQKEVYVAEVRHCFCAVKTMDKDRALVRLIETENPASAIVFCNTKANVHYVCGVLQGFGYNADELSSDLSQSRREEVMANLRTGRVRFLVATDVAARGIDIPSLSHVFLYEPPEDHESYIHRAGRTGRAGCAGTVISLVDIMEKMELERIARHYHLRMEELPDPGDEGVAAVVSNRLLALLEARFRSLTGLEKLRIARYTAMARELAAISPEDGGEGAGVNLLAMLLDACHQASLNENRLPSRPAPRPQRDEAEGRGRRRGKGKKEHGDERRADRPRKEKDALAQEGDAAVSEAPAPAAEGTQGEESGGRRRRRRRHHRRKGGEAAAPDQGQDGGSAAGSPEGGEGAD